MILRDPRDFHFIAVALAHGLARPADLAPLIAGLADEPDGTGLGDLMVRAGLMTPAQQTAVLREVVFNPRLLGALGGAAPPDDGRFAETLRSDEEVGFHNERTFVEPGLGTPTLEFGSAPDSPAFHSAGPGRQAGGPAGFDRSSQAVSGGALSQGGNFMSASMGSSFDSIGGASRAGSASFSARVRQHRPAEELLDTEIAGHVIEGVLGKGGQGQVFKARQRSLDRVVALKVLPPESVDNAGFADRFLLEARTLAAFAHPNIVQVYNVGSEDGVFWFTMEAVKGQTLKDLIKEQGRLPVEVAVNLTMQCLRGLDRAAKAGVIHRDIKPGNLLVDDQGILKIADFGLAERVGPESGVIESAQVVGTPLYVSPEQIRGRDVGSPADQYSLGATLHHMLTGAPPFRAANARDVLGMHLGTEPPDPCLAVPEIPTELGAIVMRMLAKDPGSRFPGFTELFKTLEDFELRAGLIEARSSFLDQGLIDIGEKSVRGLRAKVLQGLAIGVGFTAAAIGGSALLDATGRAAWKAPIGNWGAILLVASFAAIMYVAAVRKRMVPKFGNARVWLQAHIAMALAGYFLSMVHSGNWVRFLYERLGGGPRLREVPGGGGMVADWVPVLPFLNSLLFTAVVTSGIVGRYIWRDIAKQVASERIQRGEAPPPEGHELTMSIFAQRSLRHWRFFHYPMATALVAVTLLHVFSIVYFSR